MRQSHKGFFALACLFLLAFFLAGSASAEAKWPTEPGKNVKKDGKLQIDVTSISEGYFHAGLQSKNKHKMKLRVTKGDNQLTYDLNSDAKYEIFPLQYGDGKYTIALYENVSGKKYSAAGKITINVTLSSQDICYYYPNQYVNYTPETDPVLVAEELCKNMSQKEAYDAICAYMSKNFVYDFLKAVNIKAGVLPDIDTCYSKRMGVCQDLSAICISMMRTQGIPARLMIGYADKNYHAWVETDFGGKSYFFDPTAAVNGISKVKEYSVERFY
ncbi:MAG: transglutaminase domain-containing protein [Clostridia bacterium]|nr:transglutaminase domain-containing protein [Clostridia bacterium]